MSRNNSPKSKKPTLYSKNAPSPCSTIIDPSTPNDQDSCENITYKLKERQTDLNDRKCPTYEELSEFVRDLLKKLPRPPTNLSNTIDFQNFGSSPLYETQLHDIMSAELNYTTNYTKKDLSKIADYYKIPKRKKSKETMIEDIVAFEDNLENYEIVFRRKRMWGYIEELKSDEYLSKFVIF